jgi:hypothetical protein
MPRARLQSSLASDLAGANTKLVSVWLGWRSGWLVLKGSSSRSGWPVQQNRLRGRCTGFLGYCPRSNVTPHRGARRTLVLPAHVCVCGVGASPQTRRPAQVPRACVRSTSAVLSETPASSSQLTRTPQRRPSALGSSHVRTRTRSACSFPDIATPPSGRSPPSAQTCADMPCRRRARAGPPGWGECT